MEDLFIKLTSIASPSGSELEFAKYIKKLLSELKLETCIDETGNVFAKNDRDGTPLLLSAHLDTVQGDSQICAIKKGERITSSGNTILGADNKASICAILTALKRVQKSKRKKLEILFSVREETDGGVSKINLDWIKSKEGISADSGESIGTIVTETPFIEGFEISVTGKSSHSSEPHHGVNALSIASQAISDFKWGAIDDCTTANIGIIEGGSAVNTTPGSIMLKGEIRSCYYRRIIEVKNRLEKVFSNSAKKFNGKVRFDYQYYCDGYQYKSSHDSLTKIKNIYNSLGIKTIFKKSFGASDANFFNSKGITVVDIGDGVKDPHTNSESIATKDLNRLADIFSSYISA